MMVHCDGNYPQGGGIDEWPPADLYRSLFLPDLGYVVYRHCFDEARCSIEQGARTHKTAVFVEESEALHYCRYRNKLIDQNGEDTIAG